MNIVCIAAFHRTEDALVARSKLEFYGIPAHFPEEHFTRFKSFYVQGATLCRIEVPACFADEALYLLNITEEIEPEDYGELKQNPLHNLFLCIALFVYGPLHLVWLIVPFIHAVKKWIKSLRRLR